MRMAGKRVEGRRKRVERRSKSVKLRKGDGAKGRVGEGAKGRGGEGEGMIVLHPKYPDPVFVIMVNIFMICSFFISDVRCAI